MTLARFDVTFYGEAPDPLKVGDKLNLSGVATVKGIAAALIDVTALGGDQKYVLGDVTIQLAANRLEVWP